MSDLGQNMQKLTRFLFYILFFFTPLLLWPFTSEVFEFNKMLFVYLITILVTATWGIRTFSEKKFTLAKTPLDIPILLFVTTQILSTIFSIDRHTSIWGYYSRFHGGLASTICYVILFYALVTHFSGQAKAIRNLVLAIISTAVLTSLYAILEHFGIDKHIWVQDVQNRVFSTLGQPNWLSAYLVAILPLPLYIVLRSKHLSHKILASTTALLYLLSILFTKSQSGIAATMIVLLLFFIFAAIEKKKTIAIFGLVPLFAFVIIFRGQSILSTLKSLNKINPFYSNTLAIIQEENKTRIGGSDSMTIRRVVWQGAIELGRKYPLFGTGVETFGYSYYWVRPAAHNLTSESDFLYNKAHNEYLNFFATTGITGFLSYLFLVGSVIYLFIKTKKSTSEDNLTNPLLLGFISILITNYFGFSVVNVALFFFLFPAILIAENAGTPLRTIKHKINSSLGLTIIVITALILLNNLFRTWKADINYAAGKTSYDEALLAVKMKPNEPTYVSQLGYLESQIVTQLIAPQIKAMSASTSAEVKSQANQYLEQFVNSSLEHVNKAVSMNRFNINSWKNKARAELTLSTLDPKYFQEALKTLLKISEISPTESTNYQNIGILYTNIGKKDEAKMAFSKAIELNSDNMTARDLLNALEKTK